MRLRVRKIEPADGRGRHHRVRFRELQADCGLRLQQTPEYSFLRMVRARGITGCRAYAAILFLYELPVGQSLVGLVAPEFPAHPEVQVFGECFGKPIGTRLENDAAVIIVICFESPYVLVDADSRGYREGSDVVIEPAARRCDEIGEAILRHPRWFAALLSHVTKPQQRLLPRLILVHQDIV